MDPMEVDEDGLNAKICALMDKQKRVKESNTLEKLMQPSNSLRSLYSDILSVKVNSVVCRDGLTFPLIVLYVTQVRPKSAGKTRTRSPPPAGGTTEAEGVPRPDLYSPKRGKIRPKSAPYSKRVERVEQLVLIFYFLFMNIVTISYITHNTIVHVAIINIMPACEQGVTRDEEGGGSSSGEDIAAAIGLPVKEKHYGDSSVDVGRYLNLDAWWNEFDAENDLMGTPDRRSHSNKKVNRSQSAPLVGGTESAKMKSTKESATEVCSPDYNAYIRL
jgi:hypothetical protein